LKSKSRPSVKTAFFYPDFWNVINIMFRKQLGVRLLMLAVVAAFICTWLTDVHSQSVPPAYRDDQILIKPKAGTSQTALNNFHQVRKDIVLRTFDKLGRLQILRVPKGETVSSLIAKYKQSGLVEFAEPDYLGHVFSTTPNDPKYLDGTLWGLDKISAPTAWDVLTSASNIVVAVLDTGVRYTHEDLAANMWVNPNDGSHGWNVLAGTDDPNDDQGHGTSVAGVLGAVGNNGKGVTGVAWQVQIMACKCFNNLGIGSISSVITGMDFAKTNGARIINASWGFTNSLALSNAVYSLRDSNIIVVAACGNSAADIDLNPTYPASYHFDNVVTVADTTRTDTLATTSNYGATSVHLAAPGEQIYTTWSPTDNYYITQSGTSFAAPYVAGALALMLAKYPDEIYQQIITRLLNATDPLPALTGKCVTGGRLNLHNALSPPINLVASLTVNGIPFQLHLSSGPNRLCIVEVSPDLMNWSPVFTNTTSTNGTFDFTDSQSTNSAQRFYRATASP
jgi:subtilisin family serine protease